MRTAEADTALPTRRSSCIQAVPQKDTHTSMQSLLLFVGGLRVAQSYSRHAAMSTAVMQACVVHCSRFPLEAADDCQADDSPHSPQMPQLHGSYLRM